MDIDRQYFKQFNSLIGCDEVGRGPLAGPVVACAVRVQKNNYSKLLKFGVTDSKKLTSTKRRSIIDQLSIKLSAFKLHTKDLFDYCIWEISESEIDKINILEASLKAMSSCVQALDNEGPASGSIEEKAFPGNINENLECFILVDGNKTFKHRHSNIECLIKGDSLSLPIALASVIAKVYRDELMVHKSIEYPEYGFEKHKGYPTKSHKESIKHYGPSAIHRRSFKGVKEYIMTSEEC